MNKLFVALLGGILISFNSCSILEQAHEYERFIQCDFNLSGIKVLEINGIDISTMHSNGEIGMMDMMAISKQIFSSNFPATLSINLKASNKDAQQASIAGLDWKILMDGEELVSGLVDREVVVKPQSSTTFPVIVELDLLKLLRSESLGKIMAFAFGRNQYEEISKLGAEIKIKPYYKTNSGIKKYPGYLTIKP